MHKKKKVSRAKCGYYKAELDDANHIFFECERWAEFKHRLGIELGDIMPENVLDVML